jgi:hypothetical protein
MRELSLSLLISPTGELVQKIPSFSPKGELMPIFGIAAVSYFGAIWKYKREKAT